MMPSSPYCPTCGAANPPQAAFCFACGQALSTGPGSQTGLLPTAHLLRQRYQILAQVGKGGFGAVYQAMDTQLGNRLVAIKEMSQHGLTLQELTQAIDAFQREALLLAGLKHPNLPLIFDQFSETGRHYLVMEFIVGQTLEEYLAARGGKLPVADALQIGAQLCIVLSYLHTRQPPIIFRDLKPANVMLTAEGQLYLIDFGIARHFKPGQTRDTIAFGSPGYAAPEQYGKAQTTPRSDIYSLGAILHQMLSGNDPSETPFRFAPLDSSLPGGLAALIMQMVELDESKRPASADSVRQDLEFIADRSGVAYQGARLLAIQPPSVAQLTQPASLSSQAGAPAAPAPMRLPPIAQMPLAIIAHATYTGHADWVWSVAWSPDGVQIASASQDKTVQVWNADTLKTRACYRQHADEVFSAAWAPDGKRIASASADCTVQVWNARTATHLFTYNSHTDAVIAVAWAQHGSSIASGSEDHTVQVWDALTGLHLLPQRNYSSKALAEVYAVAWSPDGKRVVFGCQDGKAQVWRPGAKDTQYALTYRGHANPILAVAWSPDGVHIASAGIDGSVQVWDAATGTQVFRYDGHAGIVYTVAWSPDSRYLASGGLDQTVQVWTPTNPGPPLCVYREHSGGVRSIAWSPDGKRIASGGLDKTVHIWQPAW